MNDYFTDFDAFLAAHPDVSPEWRELIEPVLQAEDQQLLSFILTYLFM